MGISFGVPHASLRLQSLTKPKMYWRPQTGLMKPGRDKNDHFYDVEHKFVLFLHQTYLLLTRKIHTFN